jgi:uncharacterized protein
MKSEPLRLEHQTLLNRYWKPLCLTQNIQFAEYSFANVYLFRRAHSYRFVDCDPPIVRGEFSPDHYYLIPTTLPEQIDLEHLKEEQCRSICFFPIAEQWLERFDKAQVSIQSSRDDSDYIFKSDKLKTLGGRALSSRRNLLHQLEANYKLESRILSENNLKEAFDLLEVWQQQAGQAKDKTDYWPCFEALENWKQLGLCGRLAYADGKLIGFTIGELITPSTALMLFAKSLRSYKGVTPYLYQNFALNLPSSVEWINLEQDLGIPSLRQAKEAYVPDILLTKWRVCL